MHCKFCGKDLPETSEKGYQRKRIDAKFCSDSCKNAYHNAKRDIKRKQGMMQRLESEIWELQRRLQWDYDD